MTVSVALREVAEVNPCTPTCGLLPSDGVDFFPMAAVDAVKTHARASERRAMAQVTKGFTTFQDGDVLLAKITPCFENGKIAQAVVSTRVAFGSTEFHVLRCGPHLHGRYLVHFLRRPEVRADGQRRMTGSGGQRRVPKHFLESLKIPLPSVAEQFRIAATLDKVDSLRAKRREAMIQLDRLAQSIFIEMFGDPATNLRCWETSSFDDFFSDETSRCAKVPTSGYQERGRFAIVDQGQKFIAAYSDEADAVCPVELPVTVFGDHTRSVKHVDFPFVVGADGAKILKARDFINPRFATCLLKLLPIPNLGYSRHMKEVKRLAFVRPPRSLQDAFEDRIRALERIDRAHIEAYEHAERLFAALQHRAFQGEL